MKTAIVHIDALVAANCAASTEETRYYLNGVLVEITANQVIYVATDGHILFAHRRDCNDENTLLGNFIIPSGVIKGLAVKPKDRVYPATLKGVDDGALTLELIDGASYGFKPIDGHFPDWKKVVPLTTTGTSKHGFNPYLVAALWKAGKIMGLTADGKDAGSGAPVLSPNDNGPALMRYGADSDTFGVIMPYRQDDKPCNAPSWVGADGDVARAA